MHVLTRSCVLFLWIQTLASVKGQDCTLQNFLISPVFDSNLNTTSLESSYITGRKLNVGCNAGYSGYLKLICVDGEWMSRGTKCREAGCAEIGISRARISDNNKRSYTHGEQVEYTCDNDPTQQRFTVTCNKGNWDGIQSCEDCTLQNFLNGPLFDSNLNTTSLETSYPNWKQLDVSCNVGYSGLIKLICVDGEWMSRGTTCQARQCPEITVDDDVLVIGDPVASTVGNVLRFSCERWTEFRNGAEVIYCEADGTWSAQPPTCGAPQDCGRPPVLENGDTTTSVRDRYTHGERVAYACQPYYKVEGQSFKICHNGKWTGEMRCLKPCTVDSMFLEEHNIQFQYSSAGKLYLEHGTGVWFECKTGKNLFGSVGLRQHCRDGVLELPTCG